MEIDKLVLANLSVLVIFLIKELFSWAKNAETKLKNAVEQNTLAVHRLTVKLEFIEKRLEIVPSLEKDLSGLGHKLREIVKQIPRS